MKRLVGLTVVALLLGSFSFHSQAVFSSLYVFGDGICSTTDGPGGPFYFGNRYSNGRIWIEVLAQRQGLTYESNKNLSYYGHYSSHLVTNVNSFTTPADASNSLFVIWCVDADFVRAVQDYGTNASQWTTNLNNSLTNHLRAITNLYHAKGARTLIMPNAVDLIKVPFFSNYTNQHDFVRQRTIDFNTAFGTTLMNQIKSTCPNITVYVPDIFTLFDDIVAHPTNYGLIKPSTFVWGDLPPTEWTLNGPGTNYVFWDDLDPTAKAHAVIADVVQQVISPAQIGKITSFTGSNRLDVVNVPIGLNGFVDGSTNFVNWTTQTNFNSTNATQTVFAPTPNPMQFYRLRFPFAWSWP